MDLLRTDNRVGLRPNATTLYELVWDGIIVMAEASIVSYLCVNEFLFGRLSNELTR